MRRIPSTITPRDGGFIWLLDGHQIDFTGEEFRELLHGVRNRGLFAHLLAERPSLYSRLIDILDHAFASDDPPEESNHEHILEQLLIDMERRVRF